MSAPTHQGPPSLGAAIAFLLGRQAAVGGPFALLGLTPDDCTQDLVIVQLQRQLARIAAHPMGNAPAADAVRAALHAAAAELLEGLDGQAAQEASAYVPSLVAPRGAAIPVAPGASPIPLAPMGASSPLPLTPAPAAPIARAPIAPPRLIFPTTITPELAQAARDILAEFGGWNARSRQRAAFLAHTAGVRVDDLLAAAQALPAPPTPESPALAPPPSSSAPVGVTPDAGLYVNADGTPKTTPYEEEIDPGRRILKWLIISVLGGFAFLLILAGVAYVLLRQPTTTTPPTPPIASAPASAAHPPATRDAPSNELFPAPKPAPKVAPAAPTAAPAPTRDVGQLLRDLARAVASADADPPKALDAFDAATSAFAQAWPTAAPDQLAAMQDIVLEFVYKVAHQPDATIALDLLARGLKSVGGAPNASAGAPPPGELAPDQLRAAAWSAGVLARLSHERELPTTLALRLNGVLSVSPLTSTGLADSTFPAGAGLALAAIARNLASPGAPTSPNAPTPDAAKSPDATKGEETTWSAWIACVDALHLPPRARDRMLLLALDDLLVLAPEPTRSKRTFDAIAVLATALTWRDTDESRRWLLRRFDMPTVSAADLHALTSVLASRSSAADFDASRVLSAGASDQERTTLRDRLRQIWGVADAPERARQATDWASAADEALRATTEDQRPLAQLSRAITLSRLSETAAWLFAGEVAPSTADASLDDLVRSVLADTSRRTTPPPPWPTEPTWMVRYLSALSPAQKRQLLTEVPSLGSLTRADAAVIVGEALRGATPEILKAARDLVRSNASDPAMVNAMLDALPAMPARVENSNLVASVTLTKLPSVRSPSWRVAARRALVERLLQLLAATGEHAGIDAASNLLARSYAARLAAIHARTRPDLPKPGESSAAPEAPTEIAPIEQSAKSLRLRLEREAEERTPTGREPIALATIAARRDGRAKIAAGRVQLFAAEQATALELLAYLTAAEQPDAASQVAAILDEAMEARRTATHVAAQIEAVERAALRLWILRMPGGRA